jgi:hypothetical protein
VSHTHDLTYHRAAGGVELHVRMAWTIDSLLPTPQLFEIQFGFRCGRFAAVSQSFLFSVASFCAS